MTLTAIAVLGVGSAAIACVFSARKLHYVRYDLRYISS